MQTITFTCEVITPMFLAGADSTTPELRPASIKGALRFWWRAMNGHLPTDEMRKLEGEIFGSTEKRSNVILLPINIIKEVLTKISNTPHHKKEYCKIHCEPSLPPKKNKCSKSIQRDAKYYIFELTIKYNNTKITKQDLIDILKVAFLFGGVGKRVRRGFGSILIRKIDGDKSFESLEEIKSFLDSKKEVNGSSNFAYFKSIEIGKAFNSDFEVLEAIGLASHNHSSKWLGYVGGAKRFASPIYVSVIKDENCKYYPVITTLNTIPEKTIVTKDNQKDFIKSLK